VASIRHIVSYLYSAVQRLQKAQPGAMLPDRMGTAISKKRNVGIQKTIESWFARAARKLPWRDDPSPYKIWLCEIMAQQTRLHTVEPYFNRFIARFPNIAALAAASVDDVLTAWSGLGYYTRARNLHRAALEIAGRHGGMIPDSVEELIALPGIGAYTAAAIASIAYQKPAALLDGNVTRVLCRLFDVAKDVSLPSTRRELGRLAQSLVDGSNPRAFNQGMMELGALICHPTSPDCAICPVRTRCRAFQKNSVHQRPVHPRKKPPAPVRLDAGIVYHPEGSILLLQNKHAGLFGGLWMVPMCERKPRADLHLIADCLSDSLGVAVGVEKRIGTVSHILTHRHLQVAVYRCRVNRKKISCPKCHSYQWINDRAVLKKLAIPSLTQKILAFATKEIGRPITRTPKESGRLDLNQRPLAPQASALPDCATPRTQREHL
jgi:A/G-specific adenine glycosylase